MQDNTLLRWTLLPTILLFAICFACMALTTHSWILQDWFLPRHTADEHDLEIIKDLLPTYRDIPSIFIEYIAAPTDAMLTAACLGVGAGIVCIIGWYKLRRADMDMAHNLVCFSRALRTLLSRYSLLTDSSQPRRRFWVGFALLTLMTSFASALAALVLTYTKKGPDEFGCTLSRNALSEPVFWCTREMAGCNALPAVGAVWDRSREWVFVDAKLRHPWAADLSCTELVSIDTKL